MHGAVSRLTRRRNHRLRSRARRVPLRPEQGLHGLRRGPVRHDLRDWRHVLGDVQENGGVHECLEAPQPAAMSENCSSKPNTAAAFTVYDSRSHHCCKRTSAWLSCMAAVARS